METAELSVSTVARLADDIVRGRESRLAPDAPARATARLNSLGSAMKLQGSILCRQAGSGEMT